MYLFTLTRYIKFKFMNNLLIFIGFMGHVYIIPDNSYSFCNNEVTFDYHILVYYDCLIHSIYYSDNKPHSILFCM